MFNKTWRHSLPSGLCPVSDQYLISICPIYDGIDTGQRASVCATHVLCHQTKDNQRSIRLLLLLLFTLFCLDQKTKTENRKRRILPAETWFIDYQTKILSEGRHITEYYWVLLSITEYYWVLLNITEYYWILLSITEYYCKYRWGHLTLQ